MQRMLSLLRSCVDDYQMIEEGDRIAVGISGGKDSLTLLVLLAELKKFYPKPYRFARTQWQLRELTGILHEVGDGRQNYQ